MWNFEAAPPNENQLESQVTERLVSKFDDQADAANNNDNNDNNDDVPADANPSYAKYYHFNMYDHSEDVVERPGTRISSVRRLAAASKLPPPVGKAGVLGVLGDTSDAAYPIFRRPSSTDPGMTVATGLFDLKAGSWEIFLDNPKESTDGWIPLLTV